MGAILLLPLPGRRVEDTMRTRQTRKAATPYRYALDRLVAAAAAELEAYGRTRVPAAPWLVAATAYIRTAQGCGREQDTLPAQLVERCIEARGWAWALKGEDLVLEIPGWIPSPARVMAVQPGLFD